jgi:GT2 family glycosyltransferase
MSIKPAFVTGPCSVRVQSILYNNDPEHVLRAVRALARSAELALRDGHIRYLEVALGDCSPFPVFKEEQIAEEAKALAGIGIHKLDYFFFDRNMGTAAGHNRLMGGAEADLIQIQNPDVIATPRLLSELIEPLRLPGVGQVEARQIPIEHPKPYDPVTRETPWASTACALIPRSVFDEVGRFDAESFFLYCDDLDLSWRIRLAGYRVVFQPSASVFHDKRLSLDARWKTTSAEEYYSAEAGLILPHKYSRPDVVEATLRYFDVNGVEPQKRAAAEYRRRLEAGQLPAPIDPGHKVAQFIDGNYSRHRFVL